MPGISLRLSTPRIQARATCYGESLSMLLESIVLWLRRITRLLVYMGVMMLVLQRCRRIVVVTTVSVVRFLRYWRIAIIILWVLQDDVPCVEKARELFVVGC